MKFLLALTFFLTSNISYADYIGETYYVSHIYETYARTAVQACQADVAKTPYTYIGISDGYKCNYHRPTYDDYTTYELTYKCASIYQPSPTCSGAEPPLECTPPNIINSAGTACLSVDHCTSKKGATTSYFLHQNTGADMCIDNCTVFLAYGSCGYNNAGIQGCHYSGIFDGTTCAGADTATAPPSDPAFDCVKAGKSYGYVNGFAVCTAKGTPLSAPIVDVEKTTSSETTTTNTPATPGNPATTSTTSTGSTSTTNVVGDIATTATSTTKSDGTTSTTTKSESIKTFCEKNPMSKSCIPSPDICKQNPTIPACVAWCDLPANATKQACMSANDLLGNSSNIPVVELTQMTKITNENMTFSRITMPSSVSCPSPQVMNIAGSPITIKFDWLCTYASNFRALVIALALFFAYMQIASAIRSDSQPYQRGLF